MCRLSADQMGGTTTSTVDVTTNSTVMLSFLGRCLAVTNRVHKPNGGAPFVKNSAKALLRPTNSQTNVKASFGTPGTFLFFPNWRPVVCESDPDNKRWILRAFFDLPPSSPLLNTTYSCLLSHLVIRIIGVSAAFHCSSSSCHHQKVRNCKVTVTRRVLE